MDLDQLREALRLSPDNPPLLELVARASLEAWNLDEARRSAEKLAALVPGHAAAREILDEVARRRAGAQPPASGTPAAVPAAGPAPVLPARPATGGSGQAAPEAGDDIDELLADVERRHGERPRTTFADVGGMEELKEQIRLRVLHPARNPDLFRRWGQRAGGGVLLYGPPGCGKTLIGRAIAGEMSACFLAVGIHDVLDMWLGSSERNLAAVFETARRRRPSVVFFDEVDALAGDRSHLRASAGRSLVNQFLSEMDSSRPDNEGLLVVGATNAPWHLDPAFRRPGRFDRMILVPPPDEAGRQTILGIHLRGRPVGDVDLARVARRTEGFTGADLLGLVERATEEALTKALRGGAEAPLSTDDLLRAAKTMRPTAREWFETARNYALYANQGGQWDDLLPHLGIRK